MTPQEAFQYYVSVKLHFTQVKYDAFKFNFRTKKVKFEARKDKFFFNRLAKNTDPKGLVLANLSIRPKLWVGQLFEPQSQEIYWAWKKYQESQTYLFGEEIGLFQQEISRFKRNAFKANANQHPEVLKLYLGGKVSLDTLAILNDFVNFVEEWDITLADDPIWKGISFSVVKYRPFISYDRKKISKIIKEVLDNVN
jgi:hypothetical protein